MPDLEPENWLTYRGDHRGSVGKVMGPGLGVGVSTVVAADYTPPACDCGTPAYVHEADCELTIGRGVTRLGMVSGDARGDLAMATMPPVVKVGLTVPLTTEQTS